MTTSNSPTPGHVVIVGGGVAGLEALLALRALAGDRVDLTLVSQHDWFVDRPVTVAEPFGLASAARHSLPDIVAELDARFVGATVVAVHADEHRVSCADGTELGFDTLILAPGRADARAVCRCDRVRARRVGPGDRGDMLDRLAQRRGAQRGVRRAQHDGVAPAAVRARAHDRTRARTKQRRRSRSCASSAPEDRPSDALRRPGQPERRSPVGRGGDRVHRRRPRDPGVGGRRLRRHAAAHARSGAGRRTDHAARRLHSGR